MKKAKWLVLLLSLLMFTTIAFACGTTEKEPPVVPVDPVDPVTQFTLTFQEGDTVLKTVKVDENKPWTEAQYTPEKVGYTFMGWFATKSLNPNLIFDFLAPAKKNSTAFAGFSKYQVDSREFYILGSGTSEALLESNWGEVTGAKQKMTRTNTADANYTSITLDLYVGDMFQFALNTRDDKEKILWANKRGYGYLTTTSADGVQHFSGSGGLGDTDSKGKDIKVLVAGNYTIKLQTFPFDDIYDTGAPTYTEELKEVYNSSPFDKMTWTRNSDPIVAPPEKIVKYYIKGKNITAWENKFVKENEMTLNDGKYKLDVFLVEDDEFMFNSTFTVNGVVGDGNLFIRGTDIDEDSALTLQECSGNMCALKTGLYSFSFDPDTGKLSATVDETKTLTPMDIYIKGILAVSQVEGIVDWQQEFKPAYQFAVDETDANIYTLKGIELAEGDEFMFSSYTVGSTKEDKTSIGNYNFAYMTPVKTENANANFSFKNPANKASNFTCTVAGTYDITFNLYNKLITFTASVPAELVV